MPWLEPAREVLLLTEEVPCDGAKVLFSSVLPPAIQYGFELRMRQHRERVGRATEVVRKQCSVLEQLHEDDLRFARLREEHSHRGERDFEGDALRAEGMSSVRSFLRILFSVGHQAPAAERHRPPRGGGCCTMSVEESRLAVVEHVLTFPDLEGEEVWVHLAA